MPNRTKQAIVRGFNSLIANTDFDDITVKDIIGEAEVSKATFYRYFKDKYDVMNYNYKRLLDESLDTEGIGTYRDLYRRLYCKGREMLEPISRAFGSTGINSFERYIYEYSRGIVVDITERNRDGKGLTPDEEMQLDVFCYGISHMYKKWVAGKYALDVDEAADKLFEMMPESLRDYWCPSPA